MPDFLIIGAQKCGTTSLYKCLIAHPHILSATQKEVHFFDNNYSKGLDWYRSQFPMPSREEMRSNQKLVVGEASPYYIFHPLVPERVRLHFPEVKLIVLLRDPVARAWSQYHHEVRLGFEQLSFEEALAAETERLAGEVERMRSDETYYSYNHQHYTYLSRGIYVEQLKAWMELFPREQFLILESEAFFGNPGETVAETMAFLGVSPEIYPKEARCDRRDNAGSYPEMSYALKNDLVSYFVPHNRRLAEYLQVNFGWS
ncbi:MAG: sulfotransferase domain-containing protein [Oscillatoria sp. SIO1A7]|nr:sulfotransferase domain-containing protein [Oscillatoria sp. SIO1A7]